ncbi:MAG: M20/M25/M40 family metallo-hydrolase [Cytophagales bacterium]|nr:M20/M25/M40 family metallo-hydrolase [Cytophagales bacterium]
MMGRSASKPEHIEKATAFIESEFKKIGLSNLQGLTTYRQEFTKSRILPGSQQVTIDGKEVASENILIITEKPEVSLSSGLPTKQITFDSTAANKDQYFFDKAFALIRDTSSMLVLIDGRFQNNFEELKGYFQGRFTNNRKYTKVFVTGLTEANQYSVKASQKIESIKMANVVGILPGKSKPDEMVVFSGHYDHIGIEKPINGDSIANGADDDASGTTAVIELARYFKKIKNNERTLIFVAFTAEEIGGFGSKYFSEQINSDKVVAMFNIEMIGKPSRMGPKLCIHNRVRTFRLWRNSSEKFNRNEI